MNATMEDIAAELERLTGAKTLTGRLSFSRGVHCKGWCIYETLYRTWWMSCVLGLKQGSQVGECESTASEVARRAVWHMTKYGGV